MRTLGDYHPYLQLLLNQLVRNVEFSCKPDDFGSILENHPNLLVVMTHSTPLSWLPGPCVLTQKACAEGFSHRVPFGVVDRFFHQFPLLRPLAKYLEQSDVPLNFDELVKRLHSSPQMDLLIFPEGSNCFFGLADEIQDFRSSRFVELSICAKVPILLCVQKGSEEWAKSLNIPPEYLQLIGKAGKSGILTLPWLMPKIDTFKLHCELYVPELEEEDFEKDPKLKRQQLNAIGESIREKMQTVYDSL